VKRARFVAPAREEFLADVAYYDQVQPGQAVRFAAAVEEATARALAFPLSGSTATPAIRRVILKNFPYSIVYRPEADGMVVFAVAHHSRLPGYWRNRVSAR
jgi:plasmid stabilization system protein ParE